MPTSKVTSKRAASAASKVLRSKSTGKASKTAAASALSQRLTRRKRYAPWSRARTARLDLAFGLQLDRDLRGLELAPPLVFHTADSPACIDCGSIMVTQLGRVRSHTNPLLLLPSRSCAFA